MTIAVVSTINHLNINGRAGIVRRWRALAWFALFCTGLSCAAPSFAGLKIVVSIAPIHSLVASVTEGVSEPTLLFTAKGSAHDSHFNPSQLSHLARADLAIWVGDTLESKLAKPIHALPKKKVLTLFDLPSIHKLAARGKHDHHSAQDADDDSDTGKADIYLDAHIWLSTTNSKSIVRAVRDRLIALDREHAQQYQDNAAKTLQRIDALKATLDQRLAGLSVNYFVYHDAYQYFENEYRLAHQGVIKPNIHSKSGVRHMRALRVKSNGDAGDCVLMTASTDPKRLKFLNSNGSIRMILADPLGFGVPPGIDHWFVLLEHIADAFSACRVG